MSPNIATIVPSQETENEYEKLVAPQASERKYEIIYFNIFTFTFAHLSALYGVYLCFTSAKRESLILGYIIGVLAGFGVTAGAHRLWTHRTYKAKMPLQILLMLFYSFAYQNSAVHWIRDHRLHHKYSDTDADPHNATRGFFYSHMGWLLVKKHPEVKRRGRSLDMSDIYSNRVLMFQKKYAIPITGTICFVIPTLLPMYLWGESFKNAWHITILRYIITLHVAFLVNSAAHIWGYKPYDKRILPTQNLFVSFMAFGEGFHNYHHVFPWDYRTAELGNNYLNLTTMFIDFFAWLGWAYDLKSVPVSLAESRARKTGDGTGLWGWGDKDMSEDLKRQTVGEN